MIRSVLLWSVVMEDNRFNFRFWAGLRRMGIINHRELIAIFKWYKKERSNAS